MVQEGLGLVFVLGAGALLLRPRDFPLFARVTGRLVGLTVRSMRATKDAAEKAIRESSNIAHHQNPEMTVMRENLKKSLDKFESLTTIVRRDMADVPLNPTHLLKKGWRSWENETKHQVGPTKDFNQYTMRTADNTSVSGPQVMQESHDTYTVSGKSAEFHSDPRHSRVITGSDQSGADLMLRVIEEAALARRERHIFGKANHFDKKPSLGGSTSSATDV